MAENYPSDHFLPLAFPRVTASPSVSSSYITSNTANLYNGITTTASAQNRYQLYRTPGKALDSGQDCDLCGADIYSGIFWEVLADGTYARPFCSNNCRTLTFQADARLEREALESLGVIDPSQSERSR